MGVVYKCLDTVLNRPVALKTMNLGLSSNKDVKERFYREGKTLGELNHNNIVTVYELNEYGNTCFIVMEYLEGRSLDSLIDKKEDLSNITKMEIIRQLCDGVMFAHSKGVIHRDLKPANVLIRDDGVVKILDFGVAKLASSQMTRSGVILGTVSYMAPEQLMGEDIDERADMFSIGAIMYELFAYRKPFDGDTISQVMGQVMNTNPGEIAGVDKSINMIICKALAKKREERFMNAREMMASLEQLLNLEKRKRIKTRSFIDKTITSQIKDVRKQLKKIEEMKEKIQTHLDAATLAMRQGDFESAVTEAEAVLEMDNAHQQAEKILSHAKKYIELKADEERHKMKWVRDKLKEAQESMESNHFIRAVEICESVLKVDPENNDARVIKAVCVKKIRDFLEKVEQTDHM